MVEVKILLDQEMYPDATEGILRAIINDALGRYRSYDPNKVTIKEIEPDKPKPSVKNIDEHYQIKYAAYRLKQAYEAGLIAEVIVYALKEMKERPNLFVGAAIDAGCEEWDV